jgi:membrane protease YdiL (CAAX protease family)
MNALTQKLRGLTAVQEALAIWGLCFAAIVIAYLTTPWAKVVATVGFLYLPLWAMEGRGEEYRDYGLSLRNWRQDLRLFLILSVMVLPVFMAGYVLFVEGLQHLPSSIARHIAPYTGGWHFRPRLPDRFGEWVVDQIFVVALPEEFFYRGFIQTRLRDAWPQGKRVLGARLGPAFWLTAVLFALGHLAIFQVWRLGVFFPALLFGWMRERTHSVIGAAAFHATCNLLMLIMEASFFSRA